MFVEALKRQNPALISAALSLWQQGKIAPDCWVIDVDQVLETVSGSLRQHGFTVLNCI